MGAGITQSRWDADNFDVDDLDDEDNSWKAIAGYRFNPNYEKFDTDVVGDLDLITLGATYSFGGSTY